MVDGRRLTGREQERCHQACPAVAAVGGLMQDPLGFGECLAWAVDGFLAGLDARDLAFEDCYVGRTRVAVQACESAGCEVEHEVHDVVLGRSARYRELRYVAVCGQRWRLGYGAAAAEGRANRDREDCPKD